ncbi:MAG TPA: MaoC family dehydratase N-terminal domain-containing protein [Tepidiformaceae bacterium]|nr:MaoC family dehydratase N-terminal domain-containing protein [Tepidiformaceae bacterium]
MEASLITDEVRALVGMTSKPVSVQLTKHHVRKALYAVRGRKDLEVNDGDPAPFAALGAIEGDAEPLQTPTLMPKFMIISNEWSFERPLVVGETYTCVRRLADISERLGGRFGYSIYIRSDVEFSDSTGALVARSGTQVMQFDPANERRDAGADE